MERLLLSSGAARHRAASVFEHSDCLVIVARQEPRENADGEAQE
jgi:hypothetical protein